MLDAKFNVTAALFQVSHKRPVGLTKWDTRLGCFDVSHIELRLIEVEMNLSGISLTSYKGQFDTFLFCFCFLLFEVTWTLLGPYQAIFLVRVGSEKCFSVYSLK